MISVHYCFSNGKVGKEGMPYICIFRNRVDGTFFLGMAAVVWNGVRHQWQSFDDVPSYPYAYIEIDSSAITGPEFIARLSKEVNIAFSTFLPEEPKQLELPI
jgi:hypothetical protein